jgi:uncharacterized SAM-binding protein YcdF (DUF218 family)
VLIGLALLLGTLGMKERPGSEFFEQALFLTLISVGALFYSAVLLLNDRLMRRRSVRFKRDALLVGAVAPGFLFLLNLAAAGPISSILFEAVM